MFDRAISGYGVDLLLGHEIVDRLSRKAGVIGRVVARHEKPINSRKGGLYMFMRSLANNPKHELWTIMKEFGIEPTFSTGIDAFVPVRAALSQTSTWPTLTARGRRGLHVLPCLIAGEHGVEPRLAPRLQTLVALETVTCRPSWHELLAKTIANEECIESKRSNHRRGGSPSVVRV